MRAEHGNSRAKAMALGLALLAMAGPVGAQTLGAGDLAGLKKIDAIAAGADPTGGRDSAAALAAAIAPGGVSLSIPCGTYRLLANVPVLSDTEILGAGDCTRLLIDPGMAPNLLFTKVLASTTNVRSVFSNADFEAGNSRIAIANLRVVAPKPLIQGQYHAFSFYRAAHVTVDHTSVEGAGTVHDGNHTVFISSRAFRFTNNRHTGGGNEGSFDIWDGAEDFVVSNNDCDGGGAIQRCFTVNGLSSGKASAHLRYVAKTTSNGILSKNVAKNVKNVGIMIVGLYNAGPPPVYGHVSGVKVRDNLVDGVTKFHGVWIGEADNVEAVGNTIRHAASSCIYVASGGPKGQTSHIDLIGNRCEDSGGAGAIVIGNTADAPDHVLLDRNEISSQGAATYGYSVLIRRGASAVRLVVGPMRPGRAGSVKDGGKDTNIDGASPSR